MDNNFNQSNKFNQFVMSGKKMLRCGYTTGTCATLATKACAIIHFTGEKINSVKVTTPNGIDVIADVLDISIQNNKISCAIKKDAGDDIDVTDGMLIYSTLEFIPDKDIIITGGTGIGFVTKKGLNQPVGEYAINSTPRKTIHDELFNLSEFYNYNGGFKVTISAPNGLEIAKKTFNSNLGIINGISIIGTTGIVEPQSLQALVDTIKVEVNMHNHNNHKRLILTFGNYSHDFISSNNFDILLDYEQIKISNFVGDTLDLLYQTNIEEIILVGHIGKVVKLAGGIMNTHSKFGDCRVEIFSSYAAYFGASTSIIKELMHSATTDACIDILDDINLRENVIDLIIDNASKHMNKRVDNKLKIGIITFSNIHGLLKVSDDANYLLSHWKGEFGE